MRLILLVSLMLGSAAFAHTAGADEVDCKPALDLRTHKRIATAWDSARLLNLGLQEYVRRGRSTPTQLCMEIGRLFQQVSTNNGITTALDRFAADQELLTKMSRVRTQMTDIVDFCDSGFQAETEAEDARELGRQLQEQGVGIAWITDRTKLPPGLDLTSE